MITDTCQPCRIRFDFNRNFHHFERDAQVLIDDVGASISDLRQGYYSEDASTDQRMKLHYSTLSEESCAQKIGSGTGISLHYFSRRKRQS